MSKSSFTFDSKKLKEIYEETRTLPETDEDRKVFDYHVRHMETDIRRKQECLDRVRAEGLTDLEWYYARLYPGTVEENVKMYREFIEGTWDK